jgi:type II secretory pathway component PulC
MIKNNLFGTVLSLLLVIFLLFASVQMIGFGNDLDEIVVTDDINSDLPQVKESMEASETNEKVDHTQLVNLIMDRPMFSDTRLPPIEVEDGPIEVESPLEIADLKAKLMGVVITPENSYAMIVDEITKNREVYSVGMPLEGEQGGWSLSEITQRKVVFTSEDNKTAELELEVFGGTAGTQSNSVAVEVSGAEATNEIQEQLDKKKNADDIRKKIAERRAQMRAEALKKK